jgi:hypothetical protein
MSFYNLNKLNIFIKGHKDPLPHFLRKNVVYRLNCNNYDASYVRQTRRQLKTKILEHLSNT